MGRTTRDAVLIVVTLLVDETWLVVEPGIHLYPRPNGRCSSKIARSARLQRGADCENPQVEGFE
jgi:hypothetical protein